MKRSVLKMAVVCCLLTIGMNCIASERFISFTNGEFPLIYQGEIEYNQKDYKGILIAIESFRQDLKNVCGTDALPIVIGSVEKGKKIPKDIVKKLKGKTEQFIITMRNDKVYICGSDMRGTIYGIYEFSRQAGVSPWYWWADVPVTKQKELFFIPGEYTDGEPAVRYRGIFLNDEAPCLTSWVKNTWGTDYGGHEFYAKVFELLLRLKGNFMWPAMWGWSFYADDPLNSKTANEMGIIMGTSHHEPMARNHQEYVRNREKYGAWNYVTNKTGLDVFFREGMERANETEDLITIGMRGDGDTSMGGREGHDDETVSQDERVMGILKNVVENQRQIIEDVTGRPAEERQQVWALYKEVQKYYDKGLRVPDDVTILLSDDNWGDVRSLPTMEERQRKGGWGLYYHVDYVGAPRNTKWLNITPAANMWEQLQLTYSYGVDKLWVLNVGDLKPMEFPISMFLDFAWNPERFGENILTLGPTRSQQPTPKVNLMPYMEQWCAEQFGSDEAKEAARILNLYTWYNGRVTPEMLDARTYDVPSGEWKQVRDDYVKLAQDAVKQMTRIQPQYRDAYYQLIYYPTVAMANLYDMYYSAATGNAERVQTTFKKDKELSDYYNHTMAGGKWNGMMTQKHIGYWMWNDNFPADVAPKVLEPKSFEENSKEVLGKAVIIEAENFAKKECKIEGAQWTIIPYLGRTKSGVCVMPYTIDPTGAKLIYDIKGEVPQEATVYVITKSNLAFKNKAGHCFRIGFEGQENKIVNTNKDINEEHPYDILYPTVARRIIENKVTLPCAKGTSHKLIIEPLDPGIVFEKIIVDLGGYKPTYLYGKETTPQ